MMEGEQASRRAGEQEGRGVAEARSRPTQNQKPETQNPECARAWQALRLAHDRVARRLTADLGRHCGLAISDFDVLLHLRLHEGEDVRMHDLTGTILLSQPALSRLVGRLAERGLVARSGAADDGRAIVVSLTDQGRAVADRAMQVHADAVHDALISHLTDREQATLLQTLTRITQ
jgi:DNA-binding MarR family transcriptional regulator